MSRLSERVEAIAQAFWKQLASPYNSPGLLDQSTRSRKQLFYIGQPLAGYGPDPKDRRLWGVWRWDGKKWVKDERYRAACKKRSLQCRR